MSRKLCDSFLSQFQSTWYMLDDALKGITEEKWLTEIDGWTYADVIYHIINTQEFYIRDTPKGMKWGGII